MYDQFYEFKGRPFQLTPDPHFYFESATHRKALSYLGYGLAQGEGFIVITGDIGAGKTTLVAHVMGTIDPQRLTAVKIVSTQVEGDDLLRLVAQQFGITEEALPKAQLLQRIEAFLHAQARKGLRTLLIVDEAQGLGVSAIEELRMLSNFQLGGQSLLQIFLLGQPEFRDLMNSPELEQLRQRVIATHHLEAMLANEVAPYIQHRLSLVDWKDNPHLTQEAFSAIYAATDGVPRRINALMSRVLLLGAIDQLHEIDGQVVRAVAADMGLDTDHEPTPVSASRLDDIMEDEDAEEASLSAEHHDENMSPNGDIYPGPHFTDTATDGQSDHDVEEIADFEPVATDDAEGPAMAGDPLELHRIRDELEDLRRAINLSAGMGGDHRGILERIAQLEERVVHAEARTDDHEAALRRILTLLVDWVESEEKGVRAA
tara:strand:+ start:87529 stop:88818 length:1290 start_codon:yes stop_codon:yes gene_type:complete